MTEVSDFAGLPDREKDLDLGFLSALSLALAGADGEAALLEAFALTATAHFCSTCAVHVIDASGNLSLAGFSHQPAESAGGVYRALSRLVASKVGSMQSLLIAGEPLVLGAGAALGDAPEWQRRRNQDLLEAFAGESVVMVPMLVASSIIGIASFAGWRRPSIDSSQVAAATIATRHLAIALENARSLDRERQVADRFGHLLLATNEISAALDPNVMFQKLADALVRGPADAVVVYFLEREHLRVVATAHRSLERAQTLAGLRGLQPLREDAERPLLQLMHAGQSTLENAPLEAHLNALYRKAHRANIDAIEPRAELAVPFFAAGTLTGVIVAYLTARSFHEDDVEFFREIGRRTSFSLDHAQNLARERRLTKILQEAALPSQLPSVKGAVLSSVYRPATSELKVGGDWFDAFRLDENRVLVSIGDVTGHGLEASIIMSKLRHTLNAVSLYEDDPARIIDAAEDVLLRRFPNGIATAFVGIYDSRDRGLTYANAGHPAPFVRFRDGLLAELGGTTGLPIGLRRLAPRAASASASLKDAAMLVLYTDGLIEATRDAIEGIARLEACLAEDAILEANSAAGFIERYCLDEAAQDDVAIFALRFAPTVHWGFDVNDVIAAQSARADFMAELLASAPPSPGTDAAELIFGELLGNVRRHAPGRVDVTLEFRGCEAILHVVDRGSGLSSRRRPLVDSLSEGGRGLWLVQQLSRRLRIESFPGSGSHISAVLPVDVAVPKEA